MLGAVLVVCCLGMIVSSEERPKGYDYYCMGNCDTDVNTTTTAGTMLMGGSSDVDEAFLWMIQNSGGGDFVVLRASGTDAYNPYIYELGKVNSVTTIVFHERAASFDSFVLETLKNAEALFFAGGDQWLYMSYWKDTPVADVINYLFNEKKVTIGGTSAGMAIQSNMVFTAQFDTVTSAEALVNPYDHRVTIAPSFIHNVHLLRTITDTHFEERDRMGRLLTFLARMERDHLSVPARGIACNEQTAVLLSTDGKGRVVSQIPEGTAYFLYATEPPTICEPGQPLSISRVEVFALTPGQEFDFVDWTTSQGRKYYLSVDAGVISSEGNNGNIY